MLRSAESRVFDSAPPFNARLSIISPQYCINPFLDRTLGFGDRLVLEMKRLAPKDARLRISAPQERLYSTWIGGSILASLETFKRMWISKREYEVEGSRVLHRKLL